MKGKLCLENMRDKEKRGNKEGTMREREKESQRREGEKTDGDNGIHIEPGLWSALQQQPPTFLAPGTGFVEDHFSVGLVFPWDGFSIIQAHYIYSALYYNYIRSTSDHQVFDPRG